MMPNRVRMPRELNAADLAERQNIVGLDCDEELS
jgi:hypothetical protein